MQGANVGRLKAAPFENMFGRTSDSPAARLISLKTPVVDKCGGEGEVASKNVEASLERLLLLTSVRLVLFRYMWFWFCCNALGATPVL